MKPVALFVIGMFMMAGHSNARTTSNNGDITSTKGGIDMWIVKLKNE